MVPLPEESVKFLFAAIVTLPLRETLPVPVERVVLPDWVILPFVERLPFARTVKLGVPLDWIVRAVLPALLVSLMTNAGAEPALVKLKDVGVVNPLASVKSILRPLVVVMVFPVS